MKARFLLWGISVLIRISDQIGYRARPGSLANTPHFSVGIFTFSLLPGCLVHFRSIASCPRAHLAREVSARQEAR